MQWVKRITWEQQASWAHSSSHPTLLKRLYYLQPSTYFLFPSLPCIWSLDTLSNLVQNSASSNPVTHSYSAYLLVNPPMNSSFFSKSQKEFHCFKCLLYGHSEQAAYLIRYSHWNISLMARKTTKHSLDGYTSVYSLHTDLHCQPILNWERNSRQKA